MRLWLCSTNHTVALDWCTSVISIYMHIALLTESALLLNYMIIFITCANSNSCKICVWCTVILHHECSKLIIQHPGCFRCLFNLKLFWSIIETFLSMGYTVNKTSVWSGNYPGSFSYYLRAEAKNTFLTCVCGCHVVQCLLLLFTVIANYGLRIFSIFS